MATDGHQLPEETMSETWAALKSLSVDATLMQDTANKFSKELGGLQKMMEIHLLQQSQQSRYPEASQQSKKSLESLQAPKQPEVDKVDIEETDTNGMVHFSTDLDRQYTPNSFGHDDVRQVPKAPSVLKSSDVTASKRTLANDRTESRFTNTFRLHLHGYWEEVHTAADDAQRLDPSLRHAVYASSAFAQKEESWSHSVSHSMHLKTKLGFYSTTGFPMTVNNKRMSNFWARFWFKCRHPHSLQHVIWDVISLLVVTYDSCQIPYTIAWDIQFKRDGILFWIYIATVFFWSFDLFVSFSTGFYSKGELVILFRQTARRYARTWMSCDICLLLLDYSLLLLPTSGLRMMKVIRIIRCMRALRVLKAGRILTYLEEIFDANALQILYLVVVVMKTSGLVLAASHWLGCIWFYIGNNESQSLFGSQGWVYFYEMENFSNVELYVISLRWILGHIGTGVMLFPQTTSERIFDCFIIMFALIVLGGAVSKISTTIQEINNVNDSKARRTREVKQYMKDQQLPVEMRGRVLRFVEYALSVEKTASLDPNLIPLTLRTEIMMWQRGPLLQKSRIFALVALSFPEVFCDICSLLKSETHEVLQVIVRDRSLAHSMIITAGGRFFFYDKKLCEDERRRNFEHTSNSFDEDNQATPTMLSGIFHFGELALFAANFRHDSRLIAAEAMETYTLMGTDVANSVRSHPVCCCLLYEYATNLLKAMRKTASASDVFDSSIAKKALEGTDLHQMINLPPDLKIKADTERMLAFMVRHSVAVDVDDTGQKNMTMGDVASQLTLAQGSSKRSNTTWLMEDGEELLARIRDQTCIQSGEELERILEDMFLELRTVDNSGIYSRLSQDEERNRGMSSIICVVLLLRNQYDSYVDPQAPDDQMTREVWSELQDFVEWVGMDSDAALVVMTFLAVRGLGKAMPLVHQLPVSVESADKAVLYLIENELHLLPSLQAVRNWRPELFRKIRNLMVFHNHFNLGQLLQGENLPESLHRLQVLVESMGGDDETVFKLYLFSVVGMMSGLAAAGGGAYMYGSAFMGEENARRLLQGIQALQHVCSADPLAIFWNYICARAKYLEVPSDTLHDLVIARILCLTRASTVEDRDHVRTAWHVLDPAVQTTLTRHFLADGIKERAYCFVFLPMCIANAKNNPAIGLTGILHLLANLINHLNDRICWATDSTYTIYIDLSELAVFIASVHHRMTLFASVDRVKFVQQGEAFALRMRGADWNLVDEQTPHPSDSYVLHQILRAQLRASNSRPHSSQQIIVQSGEPLNLVRSDLFGEDALTII